MIATVARTPRILVVDDEPSILETVAGVLRDEGFDVLPSPPCALTPSCTSGAARRPAMPRP